MRIADRNPDGTCQEWCERFHTHTGPCATFSTWQARESDLGRVERQTFPLWVARAMTRTLPPKEYRI